MNNNGESSSPKTRAETDQEGTIIWTGDGIRGAAVVSGLSSILKQNVLSREQEHLTITEDSKKLKLGVCLWPNGKCVIDFGEGFKYFWWATAKIVDVKSVVLCFPGDSVEVL